MTETIYDFTFPDSGRTIRYRKVPFMLVSALSRQYEKDHPLPAPPYQLIDYGKDEQGADVKVKEPNYGHPAYIERVKRYEAERNRFVNEAARHLYAELLIEGEIDADAVARVRAVMQALGVDLGAESAAFVYLWYVCVSTIQDQNDFLAALERRSQPTEAAIQDAKATFRGPVSR